MTASILLVEDDDDMREVIARNLCKAGYQVTQAADGAAAITLLTRTFPGRPDYDVVLTDIVMGDIDGIEVINAAKSQPDAPEVLLLTGYGSLDTAIAAMRAGAFDYLQKPCPTTQLRERIAAAVQQRRDKQRQTQEAEAMRRITAIINQSEPGSIAPADEPSLATQSVPSQPERYLNVGALRIDTHRHEVVFQDQPLHITPTEYAILARMAATPGQVVTFVEIAHPTYGTHINETEARELIRWHIRNLKHKLDEGYLVSVRGVGYMLIDPYDAAGMSG